METMQKRQDGRMDSLMEKRMKEVFVRWLQENDYDEAAFLEKYSDEELVMQYVIGEERSRIYLADDQGGQAEVLCEFSTDRIGESRDLIGEVTLRHPGSHGSPWINCTAQNTILCGSCRSRRTVGWLRISGGNMKDCAGRGRL